MTDLAQYSSVSSYLSWVRCLFEVCAASSQIYHARFPNGLRSTSIRDHRCSNLSPVCALKCILSSRLWVIQDKKSRVQNRQGSTVSTESIFFNAIFGAMFAYAFFSLFHYLDFSSTKALSLQTDLAWNNVATFSHVHRHSLQSPNFLQSLLKQCSINTLTKPPRGIRSILMLPRYISAYPKMRQTEQNGKTCF